MTPRATAFIAVLAFAALAAAAPASAGAAAAPPPAPPLHVLASDNRAVEFEYVPGPGRPASATDAKGEAEYLDFDDAIHTDDPGEPIVPLHTERVIIPAGAAYHVEFSIEGQTTLTTLRFPVKGWPLIRPNAHGPWVAAPEPPPAPQDRLYPEAPVTWSVEEFRGQRVLLLTVAPLQFNPAAGTTELFRSVHVRVTFSGGASVEGTAGLSTLSAAGHSVSDPLLADLVLNPGAASPAGRSGLSRRGTTGLGGRGAGGLAPHAAAGIPPVYFGNAPQWVKLRIRKNGFYRVTGTDLSTAGVPIASVDPATIRLFAGTGLPLNETTPDSAVPGWGEPGGFREIGRTVHDNGAAGRLDPDDDVIFYGLGPDNFTSWYDATLPETWFENQNTDATVVWVTWGGTFPEPPVEIAAQAAAPEGGDPVVTTVLDKLHAEKNDRDEYDPIPYEAGVRWEFWWWQLIDSTHPGSFYWDIDLPDVDTSRPGSVFMRWWGANKPAPDVADPEQTHFLNMTINDAPLTTQWTGGIKRHDVEADSVTLRARNRITALVPRIGTNPNRIDQILLAWFEFTYWKKLSLSRNTVWFKGDSAAPGPAQFQIAGAASDAAAYDVTDPGRPVRLAGILSTAGTDQVLAFHAGAPAGRLYAAVNPAGYLKPASIAIDARPARWLRATDQPVDYLIITWDDFTPAAQVLADWRQSHLTGITETRPARVSVVRISDVYDEFSGGMVDPTAIRNFIQYVFYNWAPGEPDRLSYVCLIGDANRDARDRKATGAPNLIPTWQGGIDTNFDPYSGATSDQYSSDDFFGRLQGPTDRYTDIIIGRLPVLTAAQTLQVVRDKIIHAEQFPGFNPNRNRAVLVADDVCQMGNPDPLTTTHMAQTENSVARNIPFVLDIKKIYLYEWGEYDCSIMVKPQAKRELIRSMNEGTFLVNYIGHGSDQQIADERVLEVADVTTLNNLDNLALLVAASCSVGKFDTPDIDGLSEMLVRTPTGGCLATISATHLSVSGDNADLNALLMRRLFPNNDNHSAPVGKALLEAKTEHLRTASWVYSYDRDKKYLVLGDPASVLIVPRRDIRFLDVPDTLKRGSVVSVTGEVLNDAGQADGAFQGTVDLMVTDQPVKKMALGNALGQNPTPYLMPGAVIFTGRSAVVNGRFTATFVVPMSLRGGKSGRLRAYAADATTDAAGADSMVVGGFSPAVTDTTPPTITLAVPGGRVAPGQELDATIEDAGGINLTQLFEFRSIQLVIDDDQSIERFRADVTSSFSYDPGSYTKGHVRTIVPELAAGHYQFHVLATDNFNNRGEGTLAVDISGAGSGAALSDLYGLPNPFRASTQISWALNEDGPVKLSIYSVSGRRVREWSLDGSRGENRVEWDGTDQRGDAVANGVYLVRVAFRPAAGGKTKDLVEPIVRVR